MATLKQLPARVPFVDENRLLTAEAARSLQPLYRSLGEPIVPVTLTGSPFTYTTQDEGTLYINGGTVSTKTFTRLSTVVTLGANDNVIPMRFGDKVTITYTVDPTVNFAGR